MSMDVRAELRKPEASLGGEWCQGRLQLGGQDLRRRGLEALCLQQAHQLGGAAVHD